MKAKGTKCDICGGLFTARFMTQHSNVLCCPLCSHLIGKGDEKNEQEDE